MTQEQKDLLLKDLCARLPYGVKVAFFNEDLTHNSEPKTLIGIECINNLNYSRLEDEDGNTTIVEFVKPYLFPLSSMTEEQKQHYHWLQCHALDALGNPLCFDCYDSLDWLNKNHFDYRDLILMGLAIDATNKNIY